MPHGSNVATAPAPLPREIPGTGVTLRPIGSSLVALQPGPQPTLAGRGVLACSCFKGRLDLETLAAYLGVPVDCIDLTFVDGPALWGTQAHAGLGFRISGHLGRLHTRFPSNLRVLVVDHYCGFSPRTYGGLLHRLGLLRRLAASGDFTLVTATA